MSPAAVPSVASPAPSTSKRTTSSTSERSDRQRVEDAEVKPYVIVSDLGKGSFATVYRGYHEVRKLILIPCPRSTHSRHGVANTSPSSHQDGEQERSQPQALRQSTRGNRDPQEPVAPAHHPATRCHSESSLSSPRSRSCDTDCSRKCVAA